MTEPYASLAQAGHPQLAELAQQKLDDCRHGDLPRWLSALEAISTPKPGGELSRGAPMLGQATDEPEKLSQLLMQLHPWRKGPLNIAGIHIDTEWRSDWKWDRIAPHIDLEGHQVLDIGCGNGYFGLRMLGAGAELVAGVDPTMIFVMQWLAMQKQWPELLNFVLPMGIEDLPPDTEGFDSVFSMGVLYHRRNPVAHLQQLGLLSRPGGQIILETLVLEGSGRDVLVPPGRYARMRNVHAVPTLGVIQDWVAEAGLKAARVIDVSRTTVDEQRSTPWMHFESLRECLDPDDDRLTIEGMPAPVRAAFLISL